MLFAIPKVLQQGGFRIPGMLSDVIPQAGPVRFQFRPRAVEEAVDDFEYLQPQGGACGCVGRGS